MTNPSTNRVLIVEDEPDIASLMKHALERGGGLNVEIVNTGAAALKSVMEEPPSLVLLDLNLPFIDGLEVCRLLRGREESAAIPIIMVTARVSETDRVWASNLVPMITSPSPSVCASWSLACAP